MPSPATAARAVASTSFPVRPTRKVRHEAVRPGAERLGEQAVLGVREPVGEREGLGHVDADPSRRGLLDDAAHLGPLRRL
jgi:hypothetical protein